MVIVEKGIFDRIRTRSVNSGQDGMGQVWAGLGRIQV